MKQVFFFIASCFLFCSDGQSGTPLINHHGHELLPVDYPILENSGKATDPLIARVITVVRKDGRNIFGELEPYGKIWRMGANEATEIEFYKDVKLGNTKIKKGRYTMYALLNSAFWTLIVNKETDIWGAFKYDSTKDVARIDAPVQKQTDPTEIFTKYLKRMHNKSANLIIAGIMYWLSFL
jgi:hypothetical protein